MKLQRIIIGLLCFVVFGHALAQDMDTELANLTEKLATAIKEQGKKKIAVIDFYRFRRRHERAWQIYRRANECGFCHEQAGFFGVGPGKPQKHFGRT